MPDPLTPALALITAVEYALWAVGVIVLWRVQFSPSTRERRQAPLPLARWHISPTHFFLMAFCVITSGWCAQTIVANLSNRVLGQAAVDGDLWRLVLGIGLQLGLLAGVALTFAIPRSIAAPPPPPSATPLAPHPFLHAVGTFLIALPVITFLGYVWKAALTALGFATPEQDMVDTFREADSPEKLILLTVFAVVIAPLTEELIFRAGLFRYLHTRVPRWIALTASAAVFALLHQSALAFVPLFALGVLFSLAYERTGRIFVTILAHGLFNLHTIMLIMSGVTN